MLRPLAGPIHPVHVSVLRCRPSGTTLHKPGLRLPALLTLPRKPEHVCSHHYTATKALASSPYLTRCPMLLLIDNNDSSTCDMNRAKGGLFADLRSPVVAAHPQSLVFERQSRPSGLRISAEFYESTTMDLQHRAPGQKLNRGLVDHRIRFCPESISSQHSPALLRKFLNETKVPA